METTLLIEDERYGLPKYAGQTMIKADFLRWQSEITTSMNMITALLTPPLA